MMRIACLLLMVTNRWLLGSWRRGWDCKFCVYGFFGMGGSAQGNLDEGSFWVVLMI